MSEEYVVSTAQQLDESMRDPRVRSAARRLLWERGRLRHLLRPDAQTRLWDFVQGLTGSTSPVVANCHRRLGKSFDGIAIAVGRCLANPGHIAKVAAPSREQCSDIVIPNLSTILQSCPPELRPEQKGHKFTFRNPMWDDPHAISTLDIQGANYKKGNALRGMACDTWVLDEIRDFEHLEYLMTDVIVYQMAYRRDPLVLMLSTPPPSMDHPMVSVYMKKARRENRYICLPASENKDWTEKEDRLVLEMCGTKESVSYQREAECALISDEEALIVPEWQTVGKDCTVEWKRPPCFLPDEGMDFGWADYTAAIFGYVDFRKQFLIIEDEELAHYATTGDIVKKVKKKEAKLWGAGGKVFKLRRWADAPRHQIEDMSRDYRFSVDRPDKQKMKVVEGERHDRSSTIALLRTNIALGKVKIHPRCKELLYQLENGIWNDKRTDFVRSERLGHCDAVMALAYLNRMARWRKNPYPTHSFSTRDRHVHVRPEGRGGGNAITDAICG